MALKDIDVVTKRQICADYMDPNIKTIVIASKYNITNDCLMRVIDEANIPRRSGFKQKRPKRHKDSTKRVCPCCHKPIDNPSARFCWYCGTDIRAKELVLAERLDRIMGDISKFYPATARDEAMAALIDIKNYLKEAINA